MISKNGIRNKVKSKCEYEVSKEILDKICIFVSEFTDAVIVKCIDEFDRINRCREFQRLPKLKRLDSSILINLSDNLFNQKFSLINCEIGEYNEKTILQAEVI